MNLTCLHCNTTQTVGIVYSCANCGAPLRPPFLRISRKEHDSVVIQEFAYPFIDFSKWQGEVDFAKLRESIAIKSAIKASQSTQQDSQYARNSSGLIENALSFDLYHYCDPTYSSNWAAVFFANQVNNLTEGWVQIDNRTLRTPYGAKFRVWMDGEDNIGPSGQPISPQKMEAWYLNFKTTFESLCRINLGCYTRASYWDVAVARNDWASTMALWVAHYNKSVLEPTLPKDWADHGKKWELWQIDDKGLGVNGFEFGMQSYGMDVSYINVPPSYGNQYAWADTPPPWPGPEPEPEIDYWVISNPAAPNSLNIRTEATDAGGSATVCATSARGRRLHVIDEALDSQGRKWIKIEAWAASWLTRPG